MFLGLLSGSHCGYLSIFFLFLFFSVLHQHCSSARPPTCTCTCTFRSALRALPPHLPVQDIQCRRRSSEARDTGSQLGCWCWASFYCTASCVTTRQHPKRLGLGTSSSSLQREAEKGVNGSCTNLSRQSGAACCSEPALTNHVVVPADMNTASGNLGPAQR